MSAECQIKKEILPRRDSMSVAEMKDFTTTCRRYDIWKSKSCPTPIRMKRSIYTLEKAIDMMSLTDI